MTSQMTIRDDVDALLPLIESNRKALAEAREALRPFARIAEVLGDKPPAGMDDLIHGWVRSAGQAEFRLSHCIRARSLLQEPSND